MDEPVSSLDVDSKAEVIDRLEAVHRRLALPILYVSHDPSEVARIADRVLAMRAGRIVEAPVAEAPMTRAAAEGTLDGMSADAVRRLALTALMSGLGPRA